MTTSGRLCGLSAAESAEERRLIELQFFAPVEPREEHRMTLDGKTPRFTVRLSERDQATLDAMRADVVAIGAALGRGVQAAHQTGTPGGFRT